MEKYLLTAHDVSDEWIEIKKIIENTNDCELLEMVCDIANSPNMNHGLYVYHFFMESTKEAFHEAVIEIQHIQTYYRRMA